MKESESRIRGYKEHCYEVSNYWFDNPFWYVDISCIKQNFLNSEDYKHALTILDKERVVSRDKKRNNRK